LFKRIVNALAAIEFWAVALAVAASMLKTSLLLPALGVAAFFWPVRWLDGRRQRAKGLRASFTRRTPADWAVLLLLACLPVTLSVSVFPQITLLQALRLLQGVALFYAAVNWAGTASRLRWLAYAVILCGAGLALMAPFSVNWVSDKLAFIPDGIYQHFTILVANSVHPNVMAGTLVILLPVGLGVLWFGWRQLAWLHRAWISLATLAMLVILVLTESRGAWAALLAAVVLMAVLRWKRGWLVVPPLVAAGAILVRTGSVSLLNLLASTDMVSSLDGRLEIWSRAVYMIQDFPYSGIGMGSFGPVADKIYPFFSYAPGRVQHAHNLFLQVAVDLGLPGLVAWLAILGMVAWSSWQLYRWGRQVRDGWAAGLGAGLLCSQVALAVHGLFDAVTWGMVRSAPLVWLIWGLAFAGWQLANHAHHLEHRSRDVEKDNAQADSG
jgi:putative inorganic carbon (HCO3(-)) transporter